jgi:hypothetical protein
MKKDIAYSFCKNIELIDRYRNYHVFYAFFRYSRVGLFQRMELAKLVTRGIEEYDVDLWRKVQKEAEEIAKIPKFPKKENNILIISIFSMVLVVMAAVFHFYILLPFIFVIIFIIYLLVFKIIVSRARKSIQKSYTQKALIQDLITSAIAFFKKENINPEEYPLRLKYRDYVGLNYIKEEEKYIIKKGYIAHLDLENRLIPIIGEEKTFIWSIISLIMFISLIILFISGLYFALIIF